MRKALSVRQRSGHKNVRLLYSTTERGDGSGRAGGAESPCSIDQSRTISRNGSTAATRVAFLGL